MNLCLHCNGAILEPGKSYGYSGPVCNCGFIALQHQHMAEQSTIQDIKLDKIIELLERIHLTLAYK